MSVRYAAWPVIVRQMVAPTLSLDHLFLTLHFLGVSLW